MYYVFDSSNRCVISSETQMEPLENTTTIETSEIYNPWEIELVNGTIQKKEIKEPESPEDPPLEIEDSTYTDPAMKEILSAIAELSEAVYGLHGGNNDDNL